jgi:hypothetical protein
MKRAATFRLAIYIPSVGPMPKEHNKARATPTYTRALPGSTGTARDPVGLEDYKTNPTLYASWQHFMREHQPRTLIYWGRVTSSSGPRGVRLTFVTCPMPNCTGWRPGTSP